MKLKEKEVKPDAIPTGTPSNNTTPAAPDNATPVSTEIKQPTTSFNPLQNSVNEKTYGGAGAAIESANDIPEATYQAPPDEFNDIPEKQFTKQEKANAKKPEEKAANPDMQFASEKEKTEGAAAMTDLLLHSWEKGYKALNQLFKISEKQVNKLQNAGTVDTRVEVPYKMGMHPLSSVFRDYNNDAENLLVLEPEFKEEVHPLITEELAKAGHGLSNRQKLLFLLSMKITGDAVKAVQFISMKKDYLKFAREQTIYARRGGSVAAAPAVVEEPVVAPHQEDGLQQEYQQEERETLQEMVLKRHVPNGVNNSPSFGKKNNLARINKEIRKEKPVKENKTASAKQHIEKAKQKVDHDPAPTGKKKAGRPPGAKNKKKK